MLQGWIAKDPLCTSSSLYITSIIYEKKIVAENLPAFSFGLYHTTIKPIESYAVMNHKFNDPKIFTLWHNRLGHPGSSMMRRIIEQSHGHPLKNQKILLPNEFSCDPCSQGKLIVRPSFNKIILNHQFFYKEYMGTYVDLFIYHVDLFVILWS